MLSGRRAFSGATAADVITAVLEKDPPALATAERPILPALERLVERCLEKDPAARFQSTRDLVFALEAVDVQPFFACQIRVDP
jgi:serine/threonine protein kinase